MTTINIARALALALGLSVLSAVPAAAQALFQAPTGIEESAARSAVPAPPQTIRHRLMRIDGNVLARHVAPAGADLASNRVARAKRLDGVVVLNLFPDVTATLRRTDVSAGDDGGYIWEGEVAGEQFHEALLVVRNGQINGRVQLANRLFQIKSLGGGAHQVIELDPSRFPQGSEPLVPTYKPQVNVVPEQESATAEAATPEAATPAIARILIVYTQGAVTEAGSVANLKAEITQGIALANQSYKRAKVPLTLRLAGTMKVAYNEGGSASSDYTNNLNAITNGSGVFAAVQTQRDALKADLVSLFRKGPPNCTNCTFTCGVAWIGGSGGGQIMGNVTAADAPFGYSVVGHGCVVNLAFGHELGHNMGMQHDRYVFGAAPNSLYNFGYTNLPRQIYTIMGYFSNCFANTTPIQNCAAVNYFSSPTIPGPGGAKIGVALNKPGAADNARRLLKTYLAVSKWR